jgi:hypothetical protein
VLTRRGPKETTTSECDSRTKVRPSKRTSVALIGAATLICAAAAAAVGLVVNQRTARPWTVRARADAPGASVSHAQWAVTLSSQGPLGSWLTLARPAEPNASWRNALADLSKQSGISAGDPVHVALSRGTLGRGGALLAHTLDRPVPRGVTATLAYFVPSQHAWEAVPTILSSDRRTLVAQVHHFSIWDDLEYIAGSLFDTRVSPPTCEQPRPGWVGSVVYLDDKNGPLRWCVGHDPNDPAVLVVKVKVNRSYGVAVHTAVRPKWVYSSVFGQGSEDFEKNLLARAASIPDNIRNVFGGEVPVMGGEEADFGFTEAQVRGLAGRPLIRVSPDAKDAVVGLTFKALKELALDDGESLGKPGAYIAALSAVGQCDGAIVGSVEHKDWLAAVQGGKGCLQDADKAIAEAAASALAGALPKVAPEAIGKAVGKAVGRLAVAWLSGEAFQIGISWTLDRHLEGSAFELSVFPVVQPGHRVASATKLKSSGEASASPSTTNTGQGASSTTGGSSAAAPSCSDWLEMGSSARYAAVARMQAAHHDSFPVGVAYGSVRLFCLVYPGHTIDGVYDGNL